MSMMNMEIPAENSSVAVPQTQLSLVDGDGPPNSPQKPFDREELVDHTIRKLLDRRSAVADDLSRLADDLNELDARIEYLYYDLRSPKNKPQDVELYDGTLGVTKAFVKKYEPAVGQLQWLDLTGKFDGDGENMGNVSKQRWGSGALIDVDLFLTAGHCFAQKYPAFQVPSRKGVPLSPEEIAKLMRVNFNYQKDGSLKDAANTNPRPGTSYPVVELLEMSDGSIDYAIVRLGKGEDGHYPGERERFGMLNVAERNVSARNATLCIIQHPGRREKKVEAGHLLDIRDGRIAYNDIGTSGGSSGSPILDENGEIVGVHTKGGSLPIGGFNSGTAIGAIRSKSKAIKGLKSKR